MANIVEGEWDWMNKAGGVFGSPHMPAMMIAFSSGLKAIGLWKQGGAVVDSAQRRQQAAEFEAEQLTINAGQARAAAQRDAYFKGLEGDQLISAIRARAGAGATDPTVLNIIGQAMARQSYNIQASIYSGEEKARTLSMQAAGKRYDAALGVADAKQARKGYMLAAVGAVAEGGTSLYSKYWPKNNDPSGITPGRGYDMEFTP